MGCHCDENGKLDEQKAWLRGIYLSSGSFEYFVCKMNEFCAGWRVKAGKIYMVYY